MKLTEYVYERPDISNILGEMKRCINDINEASTIQEQEKSINEFNKLVNHYQSLSTYSSINYSKNTQNKNFQEENEFFNKNNPIVDAQIKEYYAAILNSKYKNELKEKFGNQLFNIASLTVKTNSDKIIDIKQQENNLTSEYIKLIASAKIEFEGTTTNLTGLAVYYKDLDRNKRLKAQQAKNDFFKSNQNQLNTIFDDLVQLRHQKAIKLGYKNYVAFGYDFMNRSDYNYKDVASYRDLVLKYIVPVCTKLREKQKERLELDTLYFHDEPLLFKNGNPQPKGNPEWIVEQATEMYRQLSPETNEFFEFMKSNDLLDLVNREGKAGGGYCTYIPDLRSPFIFSNFNGTTHDIKVLTHEAGHAFQVYNSRDYTLPEYYFPTYEACEIHSMSMEFLTWPWMELFFKEDLDKFKYEHLFSSLTFLPYGVAVDEFQHIIYEHPDMTPNERHSVWKSLEEKYLPHRIYKDVDYIANGGYWQGQAHIYKMPFYYIDYTLAQICAFQFFLKSINDRIGAWKDYLKLCKLGGSQSFLELVNAAGLKSPFNEDTFKQIVVEIENELDKIEENIA